ncbi:MAG: hypothetical protein IID32_03665 [Planctomycetes bacterium]|nr:hypothetical protein [Planctomycetota bacterium]
MSETGSQSNTKMMWLTAVVVITCAGAFQAGWGISARDDSSTHSDEITAILSEPNQIRFEAIVVETVLKLIEDPNAFAAFITTDEPDPGQTPIRESEKPHKYWQRRYHRQVNDQLFAYLKYPYGDAGGDYSQSGPKEIAAVEANSFGPMREGIVAMTDLIHRWRDMNESEGTMLEVVRAIELTKAATQIYRLKPKLAVAAKRTVGRIGQLNRKFDLTSKMAIELILRGFAENELRNRTEKHLTDLEALLDLLARQNDALSEALGMGRIDRMPKQPDYLEKIDYSAHLLPRPITMDP